MHPDAARWIERLRLERHPEGGWFRETYRSPERLEEPGAPGTGGGPRALASAIYFLLDGADFSAFHRLRSDELWHFHAGSAVLLVAIDEAGRLRSFTLGCDAERGETPQVRIKAGWWYAARLEDPESYALAGCTVSPGFEFADWELARREELEAQFPQHARVIGELTRA
ncbi:MAG TPA: cupin domain-containing protein [Candidatus Saccharimonadales bacterium]|nr:cupin domain-containing protein [Candidatus Saccharimonadales bacterium]